ncbi:glycine/sarcosine/betaine reductase selenoprotein B family protein [Ilumatobacter sp.]|uniref:glycine/sarcosine/betaine reductase selenoprotein B family protein n=1 Tax=Ilumatobacter sp. TaxID=1967498 RepID=UPI0037506210
MTDNQDRAETLAEFKDSFFYGSRSNLNAKFLASLTSDEAGDVVADLFAGVSQLLDDGDAAALIGRFISAQQRAYAPRDGVTDRFSYDDQVFVPLSKPVSESRIALVTSSGHFVDGDDPQPFGVVDMTQAEAEARIGEFLRESPTLSSIPTDVAATDIRVRHGGYPIDAVRSDHQVALPIGHLRTLADRGRIGEMVNPVYSFVGAAAQLRLRNQVAPAWADMLRDHDVDLALLVPV